MRIHHIAVAALVATGFATLTSVGTASADGVGVQFDHDVDCGVNDVNTLTLDFELTGDPGDQGEILFNGSPAAGNPHAPGVYQFVISPAPEGWFHVQVKDPDGTFSLDWGALVACEGPVITAKGTCQDTSLTLVVGLYDVDASTYDVRIDGVVVGSGLSGNAINNPVYYGGLTVANHLVEVFWLQNSAVVPYFSANVVDACAIGSGGQLGEVGAETAPLLLIASGLLGTGALLLVVRRRLTLG